MSVPDNSISPCFHIFKTDFFKNKYIRLIFYWNQVISKVYIFRRKKTTGFWQHSRAVLPAIYLAVYMYIRQPSRSSITFAFLVLSILFIL
jgi:hypothetical protein